MSCPSDTLTKKPRESSTTWTQGINATSPLYNWAAQDTYRVLMYWNIKLILKLSIHQEWRCFSNDFQWQNYHITNISSTYKRSWVAKTSFLPLLSGMGRLTQTNKCDFNSVCIDFRTKSCRSDKLIFRRCDDITRGILFQSIFIYWMVFYAAFNSISVISRRQLTLFVLSWVSPVLDWALKCLAQGHSLFKVRTGYM